MKCLKGAVIFDIQHPVALAAWLGGAAPSKRCGRSWPALCQERTCEWPWWSKTSRPCRRASSARPIDEADSCHSRRPPGDGGPWCESTWTVRPTRRTSSRMRPNAASWAGQPPHQVLAPPRDSSAVQADEGHIVSQQADEGIPSRQRARNVAEVSWLAKTRSKLRNGACR